MEEKFIRDQTVEVTNDLELGWVSGIYFAYDDISDDGTTRRRHLAKNSMGYLKRYEYCRAATAVRPTKNTHGGTKMSVYIRYFKATSGPMVEAAKDAHRTNNEAIAEYRNILDEIGAKPGYYHREGRLVAFDFDKRPDQKVYKPQHGGWYPKANCKVGKEIIAKIKAVKTKNVQDALFLVGLSSTPTIFMNGRCYYSTLSFIPDDPPTVYVSIPWFDEDPEKIEQYKKDHAEGVRSEANFEAILWTPTPEMVEVKKWEVEKHIAEWNEKVTAQATQ